ncbi:hypothetical protein B5X24_HaOG200955 [Helicoverpa armigera]|uniref:Gustatory receptor n=1 Tax=Helicoverpa armigera TaxID=29058 RepID=A0A2W1B1C4_HELAM|nr:hypothetical protein B5X24_HaOG200955 [Helicoverpa armigera]
MAIQYSVHAIYSFVTSEKQVIRLYTSVKTSDAIMGFKNLPYVSKAVLVPIHITLVLWMLFIYLFWIDSLYLPRYIIAIASDVNLLTVSLLLFGLYSRMRVIQNALENNFVPVNIVGKDQLQKNSNPMHGFTLAIINMASIIVSTSPAIISELISNEIETIKATLVTQLVRCSDPSLSSELEVALHYIHIRPFKFVICRAVPVDINMPNTIISFCVTYVIVIMQFIHFSSVY